MCRIHKKERRERKKKKWKQKKKRRRQQPACSELGNNFIGLCVCVCVRSDSTSQLHNSSIELLSKTDSLSLSLSLPALFHSFWTYSKLVLQMQPANLLLVNIAQPEHCINTHTQTHTHTYDIDKPESGRERIEGCDMHIENDNRLICHARKYK